MKKHENLLNLINAKIGGLFFRYSVGTDVYADEDGHDASIFDGAPASYHRYADPQIAAAETAAIVDLLEIRLMEETAELDPLIYDIAAKVLPLVIQQLIENEEPLRKKEDQQRQPRNQADRAPDFGCAGKGGDTDRKILNYKQKIIIM